LGFLLAGGLEEEGVAKLVFLFVGIWMFGIKMASGLISKKMDLDWASES
jgi:hypothetical protein